MLIGFEDLLNVDVDGGNNNNDLLVQQSDFHGGKSPLENDSNMVEMLATCELRVANRRSVAGIVPIFPVISLILVYIPIVPVFLSLACFDNHY